MIKQYHIHYMTLILIWNLLFAFNVNAQEININYNGEQVIKPMKVINRIPEQINNKSEVELNLDFFEGLAWIEGVEFNKGTIDLDIKGEDFFQHSFVGMAFNAVNDSTYEAVYFRPFQFYTDDMVRRNRGIQYIAMPEFTWQKLRATAPGKYENEVKEKPDPNDWFHVTIEVEDQRLKVFVNYSSKACLEVTRLKGAMGGGLAFFVADQSGGHFKNLKISSL